MSSGTSAILYSGKGIAADLNDPHNWIGGIVPGPSDTGVITKSVGGTVEGTFDINNLMLLGDYTIDFAGSLDTAGAGSCEGLMVCDEATAIFKSTATLSDQNALIVGNDDSGTLVAEGSDTTRSVIGSVNTQIGRDARSDGTIIIDGGIWTNTDSAVIGKLGAGTLSVLNEGSATFDSSLAMAAYAGSSGTLTIAGGGTVDVLGALHEGGASLATFGTAAITIAGTATLTVDQALWVGTHCTIDLSGGTLIAGVTADSLKLLAGGVVTGYGTIDVPDASAIQNDGVITAAGGTLELTDNVIGTGTLDIESDSVFKLTGSSIKPAAIDFVGAHATLALAHDASVSGNIIGFAAGDIIAIANIDAVSFTASSGTLKVTEAGGKVLNLHLLGTYTGDSFALHQTASGTQISLTS